MSAEVTRQIGVVERRRDLDDVHPDDVQSGEAAQHRDHLARRESAWNRRARARSERGIEAIDIDRHVERLSREPLAELASAECAGCLMP